MAIRTNEADVYYYFETSDLDPTKDLEPVILTASLLIDQIESFYDDPILEQMEKFLACHIIAHTFHRQVTETKRDDEIQKYTGTFGQDLKATSYGQLVLTLDTQSVLEDLFKRKTVSYSV